jgi:hypothetical protein
VKAEIVSFIAFGLVPMVVATILLFFWNLMRAPVFIRFEKEKEPRLAIINGVVRSFYGQSGHSWELVIRNLGTDKADDCRGTLVDIDFGRHTEGFSMEWWPKNEQLQWAERSSGIIQEFSIPGGESRNLRVIINELTEPQKPYPPVFAAYLAYARDELSRERSALYTGTYCSPTSAVTIDTASSILVISVTSKDRAPIFAVCYLQHNGSKSREDYKLTLLEKDMMERPSIDTCRKMLKNLVSSGGEEYDRYDLPPAVTPPL